MTAKYEPVRQLFQEVDRRVERQRWVATAIVTEIRPEDRSIRVAILPELTETNWVKVYYFNAGSNYMSGQIPELESEVVCLFLGADPNAVIVLAGGFLENDATPDALTADYAVPIQDKYGNKIVLSSGGITVLCTKDINITSSGAVNVTVKGNTTISASGTVTATTKGNTTIDVTGTATVKASTKAIVDSPAIELGAGATEAVIKGNTFQTFFNSHTHASPTGVTSPPTIPSDPTHLSTISKTK